MSSRKEHLEWCKKRALEYINMGQIGPAWSSMISDLSKHPETVGHLSIELGMRLSMAGHLSSLHEMRKFIEDFN